MAARSPARLVVCGGLVTYLGGILTLAVLPWPPGPFELAVGAVALVAIPGLAAWALGWPLPGSRWAYLGTGFVGTITLTAYLLLTRDGTYPAVPLALLLAAGVVGAFGAHLARAL